MDYNTLLKDCVLILHKVLLKDLDGQELAFGKYKPEDIVTSDKNSIQEHIQAICNCELFVFLFISIEQIHPFNIETEQTTPLIFSSNADGQWGNCSHNETHKP